MSCWYMDDGRGIASTVDVIRSYLTSYFDVVSGVKPSLVAQWLVVQLWHLPAKNFSVGFHSYINPVAMQINSVFV